jgi:hypothetical protein
MNATIRLTALLVVVGMTSGCELIQSVPGARGRVIDVRSGQPIAHAAVVRTCSGVPKKKTTNADGEFHFYGRWRLQVALGDTLRPPRSYVIEAGGYQSLSTNCVSFGWATCCKGETDDFGTIAVTPK